jgi:predicted ABC-type ATPase
LLQRLAAITSRVDGFAIETTLSSRQHLRRIPQWRAAGYVVWLYFLEVENADFAVARVAQRVASGGHGIAESDIRRRYTRSLALFPAYQTAVDVWYHFQVDARGPRLVDFQDP